MNLLDTSLFFVIAFFAATIASLAGFGSATILTPFAGLIIDVKAAIVLVAFFHFFSNGFRLLMTWKSVNKRLVLIYGVPSILSAFGGALLLDHLDVGIVSSALGAFIIIFCVSSFIKPTWSLPDRNGVLISGGAVSGLTSGVIGLGGAIRSMFLISTNVRKEVYLATTAAIAVMVDITRISVYMSDHLLQSKYYFYILPLAAVAFLGTFCGAKLFAKLPEFAVKHVVLVLLAIAGTKMLFS